MSRSLLQKRIASALLLTTVAIQLHASGAWSALQSTPVFEPLIGVSNAEAQSSGFFAQNAAPKYGNTWLSSITCRQSNGTNVVRGMESGTGHPDLMWQAVRDAIQSRGLSITPPSVPILRSTGATGAGFEWDDNSGTENIQTLQAVCQIFGYESYVSSTCRDWIREGAYPNGRCNFHSPENNQLSSFSGTVSQSQCQDGIDNDNDGRTDFPSDPGCTSVNDTDETNAVQCPIQTSTITSGNPFGPLRNLVNNSGQGFIPSTAALHYDAQTALKLCQLAGYNHVVSYDCTAPAYGSRCGYASFGDNQMYAWNGNSFSSINDNKWIATLVCSTAAPGQCNQSQCQDGIDNDNDGATDFPGDFSCSSATDNDETNPRAACQDGIDNDQDGQTDFPQDIGCTSRQDNDEFNAVQCTATRVTTSFEGKQGPWEDVAPSGDAKAPTFISNVQAGGTMKLVSVSGTYSARIYGGQDQLPLSCDNGTVSFTNNSNQTLQKVKLNTFGSAGITVPNGATRAYLSHDEPGSFNYFDNSGNRDHRTPCQVTLDVTPNSCQQPQCADGIDNDGDGLVDFPQDPGCFNSSDNDESPRNIANLDVEKTIQGSIVPGQNVTYVITVRNTGSVNAQNVNVFDYFLDQNDEKFVPFTFVSSTGVTCSYQSGPQQISCPINAIAPGNTVTIGLTFNVPQSQACNTQIRNRAEAWLSGQQLGADVDDVVSNVQCINQCQDGIDNDQDSATDFPADFSCSSPTDTDETNPKAACQDGIDNDGDNLVDFPLDTGCSSRQDNDEFNAPQAVDLSIQKTTNLPVIIRGNTLVYTITVGNALGAAQANNVVVTDTVPNGLTFNDAQSYVPCSLAGNQVTCPIGTLPAGSNGSFQLAFDVPTIVGCTGSLNISNSASISANGQTDSNTANNTAVQNPSQTRADCPAVSQCQDGIDNDQDGATDFPADFSCSSPTDTDETNPKAACQDGFDNDFDNLVDFPLDTGCTSAQDNDEFNAPQMIDLSIQKTTNQPVIVRGNTLVYTITVSNAQGAAQANNVIVTDNVPTGLTFNDAQSYVPCSVSGNQVTCPIGTLPAGASGSFQLAFDVPTIQNCTTSLSITNTAVITALPQQDSNNVNNTASQVPAQTRADCPAVSQCQDGIDNDQDGATDFPQDFSCSSPTDTDETNPKSACQDGVDNDFDGFIDFPLDAGCTSAQDNDEFNAPQAVDLSIVKTTNQPVIIRGNTLIYTITVGNAQGAAQATNVVVTDTIPTGLTFNDSQSYVPCSLSGFGAGAVTCPIGILPAGTSGSFQIAFDVPTIANCTAPLNISNTATITSQGQTDSNQANNTAVQNPAQTRADCPSVPQCNDGIDNDQDGATDFPADFSCSSPTDTDETNPKSACQDGFDNDFDGKIDFPLDTGCTSAQDNDEFNAPLPACQDGIDNDGDGRTDLQDPGCSGPTDTNEGDEAACQDLRDNDGDNLIDFPFDPGCANPLDTDEFNQIQTVDVQIQKSGPTSIVRGNTLVYTIQVGNSGTAAATNVVVTDMVPAGLTFNDNASYLPCSVSNNVVTCPIGTLPAGIFGSFTIGFDVPTIQNCTQNQTPPIVNSASITSTEDTATTGNNVSSTANAPTRVDCPATTQCSDFNDNDFDGRIDFPADPGCSSPQDNDEFNAPLTQCSDGVDNDFDGRTDLQDPGCSGPNDTNEGDEAACQDLRDNDFDGLTDFPADPGCTGPTDTDETNVVQTQCNDGVDNDGDGRIDSNDAGCSGGNDNNEGDGAADLSISLTGPATIQGGGTAQYVATVANNGPDAATTPFSLRVSVPTGVTFNAGLSSQGCTQQGAFVVCSGITLGLFQQTTRNVVFNIPASGFGSATFESLINLALGIETAQAQAVGGICNTTIVVNANVVPVQPDPNQGNNNAQAVNTFVSCQAAAQCSDGVDNDFDGRVDFPLDPGCANAQDNNEGDDPIQTGCIEIMKETYDPHGNRLPVDAQFTFILDATRVTYNGANGRARFDNVTPGQHGVAEIIPSGWTQLSVSPQNGVVNVTAGVNCAQVTFRNRQVFVSNAQCADGYDNDGDGLTDFPADTGCTSATDNDEYNSTFVPQCRDGVDNDGDNLVDFPNDLGCVNADDNNEQNQTVQAVACADGVDNDGDGLVDLLDPGCANAADTSEANTVVPQLVACNDGIDNDQDGTIDFPLDTGCQSATDTDEFNFRAPRCNDGIDNDGDGATDFPLDPGCNTPFDDNEWNNRFWADRWREFWNWNW